MYEAGDVAQWDLCFPPIEVLAVSARPPFAPDSVRTAGLERLAALSWANLVRPGIAVNGGQGQIEVVREGVGGGDGVGAGLNFDGAVAAGRLGALFFWPSWSGFDS